MPNDRDRLIELIHDSDYSLDSVRLADYLIAGGVILPPCKVGDEIWAIERDNGEPDDIVCIRFLAKSKGCIIATSWINGLDIDETIEYHINKTQCDFETDLLVYPDEDCFSTKKDAEKALERSKNNA